MKDTRWPLLPLGAGPMPPNVFISYSRHDGRDYADTLWQMLEAAGVHAWRDQRSLNPYNDFTTEIEGAIRDATHVVVCVTPSLERTPGSFVRREIIYAEGKGKPILPLVFEGAALPVLVNHLTWLAVRDLEEAFPRILERLKTIVPAPRPDDDPCRPYLLALLNQIVAFLEATTFTLIPLRARLDSVAEQPPPPSLPVKVVSMPLAVREVPGALADEPEEFTDFAAAFERFGRSVFLLGEPGAGKTTTLWTFAREAILRRLADPAQPLPLLAQIPTWDPEKRQGLVEWLGASIGGLDRSVMERAVLSRNALLFLDGLDELSVRQTDEETGKEYDPRTRFASLLPPGVPRVITCRLDDFRSMRQKLPPGGAVVLQPLGEADIAAYLHEHPRILTLVESDPALLETVRTPLLLSLLTYALSGEDEAELRGFEGSDRRDRVFELYVRRRYAHEAARANARLPYTLDETLAVLSDVAVRSMSHVSDARVASFDLEIALAELRGDPGRANTAGLSDEEAAAVFPLRNAAGEKRFLARTCIPFGEFVDRLHLLVINDSLVSLQDGVVAINRRYHFFHLLLRDFLAFRGAVARVREPGYWIARELPFRVLDALADPRAVEPLLDFVRADGKGVPGRIALSTLAKIGDPRAFGVIAERIRSGIIPGDEAVRKAYARQWRSDSIRGCGRALARLAPDAAALAALLSVPDALTREAGAWAFGTFPERRPADAEALIRLFSDPDAGVREAAAHAFAKIPDPRALSGLVSLLRDESVPVRVAAATALGASGSPDALEPLLAALGSWRAPVRTAAAEALGTLGDPRALPGLLGTVRRRFLAGIVLGAGPDHDTLHAAMRALGALGDPRAFPLLARVLGNGHGWEREVAAEALGALGDPRAVPLLQASLRWSEDWQLHAFKALAKIPGPEATRALAGEYLASGLIPAAEAILERNDPAAVESLVDYLTGEDVPWEEEKPWMVLEILRELGTPESLAIYYSIIGESPDGSPAGEATSGGHGALS